MIEFFAGLLLGVPLGILLDRMVGQFKRPSRLELQAGFFTNTNDEQGIKYTVRNLGRAEIPEYRIELFHPDRGILAAFSPEDHGPLGPGQSRRHLCVLRQHGDPNPGIRSWLGDAYGRHFEADEIDGFTLRLATTGSGELLLESADLGNAVARVMLRAAETGIWAASGQGESESMSMTTPRGVGRWLPRRRR